MATAHGRESVGLSDRLFREPFVFDFFQAVRVLERLAIERADENAVSPRSQAGAWERGGMGYFPVGEDQPPEQEAVRFRAQPSLSFPTSTIVRVVTGDTLLASHGQSLKPGSKVSPVTTPFAEMTVTFMGVTGPIGVLPYHYTALLLRRLRDKDFALRDFLDLFHHREISFLSGLGEVPVAVRLRAQPR